AWAKTSIAARDWSGGGAVTGSVRTTTAASAGRHRAGCPVADRQSVLAAFQLMIGGQCLQGQFGRTGGQPGGLGAVTDAELLQQGREPVDGAELFQHLRRSHRRAGGQG